MGQTAGTRRYCYGCIKISKLQGRGEHVARVVSTTENTRDLLL
jgi:hypothetical protein